jgi:hypothetical protein
MKEGFLKQGYRWDLGAKFYVQPTDEKEIKLYITKEVRATWDPLWIKINQEFEDECDRVLVFGFMTNQIFLVLDGNYQLHALMSVAKEHAKVEMYHPRVKCVVLKEEEAAMIKLQETMHGVNK